MGSNWFIPHKFLTLLNALNFIVDICLVQLKSSSIHTPRILMFSVPFILFVLPFSMIFLLISFGCNYHYFSFCQVVKHPALLLCFLSFLLGTLRLWGSEYCLHNGLIWYFFRCSVKLWWTWWATQAPVLISGGLFNLLFLGLIPCFWTVHVTFCPSGRTSSRLSLGPNPST